MLFHWLFSRELRTGISVGVNSVSGHDGFIDALIACGTRYLLEK